MNKFFKKYILDILIFLFAITFSSWLMWHTFSYKDGSMVIAAKVWSDFASHVPLIRSFSLGNNIPPEYPLFSGEPIRYHFLFYFVVGLLERVGVPLDFALNVPSALSFTLLIITIYLLSKKLFQNKAVGILSVIFFLFNGSLSFLDFFKTHPLSQNIIGDIITNAEFPSFAPYGSGIVSAFWSLNIYTNQRHLALPLSLLFLMIFWIISNEQRKNKPKIIIITAWGVLLGFLLFAHSSIFIMAVAVLGILFLILPRQRLAIFIISIIGFLISLPRGTFLKESANFIPQIKIGYLIADNLNVTNFIKYWFLNLGLFWIFLPVGFILSSTTAKRILVSFLSLFIIGNTIQFSPEMAGNHKFFNVFVIVGDMFVAFALVKLWSKNVATKFIVPFIFFFLILSGLIDFFPIKNDRFITVNDYPKNPDILWIIQNTPKNARFLNSSYIYHPASLAGRKIFYGWPYFAWSLGYNTNLHSEQAKNALSSHDKKYICRVLVENKLDYVDLGQPSQDFPFDISFWQTNFQPIYQNPTTQFTIYQTKDICKAI